MSTSPETSQPIAEQSLVREYLDQASAFASVAYNGLRAKVSEVRLARAEGRTEELAQSKDFFEGLQDIAKSVITDEAPSHPNLPEAPKEKFFLERQALGQEEILGARAKRGYKTPRYTPTIEKPELERPFTPKPALTKRQRQEEIKLAEKLHFIRDGRKTQAKRTKVFGKAGPVSGIDTLARKAGLSRSIERAYKNGDIDAFERSEQLRKLDTEKVVHPPEVVRKTGKKLEKTGKRTLMHLSKTVRSIERQRARSERVAERRGRTLDKREASLLRSRHRRDGIRQLGEAKRQRLYDHLNQMERERLAKLPTPPDKS